MESVPTQFVASLHPPNLLLWTLTRLGAFVPARRFGCITGRRAETDAPHLRFMGRHFKRFVRMIPEPMSQAGQRKVEQFLNLGGIQRRSRASAARLNSRTTNIARCEDSPGQRAPSIARFPSARAFAPSQVIEPWTILSGELPDRPSSCSGRDWGPKLVGEKLQRSSGLPCVAQFLVETARAGRRDSSI